MKTDLDRTLKMLVIAVRALCEIKHSEGKVCDNFELCHHRACQSSFSSWYIAGRALKEICK